MSNKSVVYAVLSFSLLVSAVCGAFMTCAEASGYDSALSFGIVSWMFVCCLAVFMVLTFAFKKKFSKKTDFRSQSYVFTSALGVFLSGGFSIYALIVLVYSLLRGDGGAAEIYEKNVLVPNPSGGSGIYPANLLMILALVGTAVYFSFCIFSRKERKSTLFAALSIFPGAAFAVKLISDFLAQNSSGYSKLYNFHLLSLAFFLLFFVNESRIYMKKNAVSLYVFFGAAGSMSALIYVLPSLAFRFHWAECPACTVSAAKPMYLFADLLTVLYVYVRLFSLGFREPAKASAADGHSGACNANKSE